MLTVGGKEVVFSKTVLIGDGETAVLNARESLGFDVHLYANAALVSGGRFETEGLGDFAKVSFPFVKTGGLSFHDQGFVRSPTETFDLRLGGQSMGDVMLVHVDICRNNPTNSLAE